MNIHILKRLTIQFLLSASVLSIGCASRGTILHYVTPNQNLREIKLIAILPSPWESQDDDIYYATNYLYNKLIDNNKQIKLIDLDKMREFDSGGTASKMLDLIDTSFTDIKTVLTNDSTIILIPGVDSLLLSTDLGIFLIGQNVDAILFGMSNCHTVDRITILYGEDTYTVCSMNYYLISVNDGRILWHMEVEHDRTSALISSQNMGSGFVREQRQITPDYYVLQDVVNTLTGTLKFPLDKLQTPHKSYRSNQRRRHSQ
jgi:hypothetical protein